MQKLFISRLVMVSAICMIVAFQLYWVNRLYKEENDRLQKQSDVLFKELVYKLQLNRFKADTLIYNTGKGNNLFALEAVNSFLKDRDSIKAKVMGNPKLEKLIMKMAKDTMIKSLTFTSKMPNDSKSIRLVFDSSLKHKFNEKGVSVVINSLISNQPNSDSTKKVMLDKLMQGNPQSVLVFKSNPKIEPLNQIDSQIVKAEKVAKLSFKRNFTSILTRSKPIADSLSLKELDSALQTDLKKSGILLSYKIKTGLSDSIHLKDTVSNSAFKTSIATVGFISPKWYQIEFESPSNYLYRKIFPQVLFSFLLIVFTTIAFVFLYRNLLTQQKLAAFKNDFISNMTHELKTPIATVNVAIEALQSFNVLEDPKRTKEYLQISSAELQRLGLLVDKVLKLSMFESDRIVLDKEWFNVDQLIAETIQSMQPLFDKQNAEIHFSNSEGPVNIFADKLHISSVVYNLLDNALKYSGLNAIIRISLSTPLNNIVEISITDNGIGIDNTFQKKIFEKFFRVPTGDTHNVKGYGLGLSYVSHIVKQHQGLIEVESLLGKGSTFTVRFPIHIKNQHNI
ncbi:MAG: ATP-binding protein [Sphingobacteriia bacterium]|jgi:signal transduction histidine kinase